MAWAVTALCLAVLFSPSLAPGRVAWAFECEGIDACAERFADFEREHADEQPIDAYPQRGSGPVLRAGADPNLPNPSGETALDLAASDRMAALLSGQGGATPKIGDRFRDCAECPEMVVLRPGSFRQGSPPREEGREENEGPRRQVTFQRPFALGVYEVTVAQFRRFAEQSGYRTDAEGNEWGRIGCATSEHDASRNMWDFTPERSWRRLEYAVRDDQPVTCVSWHDAKAYAGWLSEQTGKAYRLPSESEWEYAARAGSGGRWWFGEDERRLCEYGNVADETKLPNGRRWDDPAPCEDGVVYPTAVGSFDPNAWGLHDMIGNVTEWTEDCWNETYRGAPGDGSAWLGGDCDRRVSRGGSWTSSPTYLRAAKRVGGDAANRASNKGFRVARALAP